MRVLFCLRCQTITFQASKDDRRGWFLRTHSTWLRRCAGVWSFRWSKGLRNGSRSAPVSYDDAMLLLSYNVPLVWIRASLLGLGILWGVLHGHSGIKWLHDKRMHMSGGGLVLWSGLVNKLLRLLVLRSASVRYSTYDDEAPAGSCPGRRPYSRGFSWTGIAYLRATDIGTQSLTLQTPEVEFVGLKHSRCRQAFSIFEDF